MADIIGTNGNDTLVGSDDDDTINGLAGNDTITSSSGNDTLTGGGGKDKFVYKELDYEFNYDGVSYRSDTITDFGGVGKGTNPTAAVIAEVDILIFQDEGLTARNLQLTQNGNNLEISFAGVDNALVTLQNFALENLDNLSKSTGATVDLGNILFYGQTSITDSFDVFNANSTQSNIFNKNTVTFLNDLSNNVNGFDKSDDVINGQGGDDIIDGKSGNDLLRGGAGNNTLNGGAGDDILNVDSSSGNNLLSGGNGNDFLRSFSSSGKNTLNGGAGNDNLNVDSSLGNNLLSGGDGNDFLSASGYAKGIGTSFRDDKKSEGNNTLNGGTGNDTLDANGSTGNNLLSGGDGDDYLSVSGYFSYNYDADSYSDKTSGGNNTLNGGTGNDTLDANGSTGNNLLSGGDGNDSLYGGDRNDSLYGGDGNDTFAFYSYNEGIDSLYDFNATDDLIQVSADGFNGQVSTNDYGFYDDLSIDDLSADGLDGKLSTPSLKADQFTIGTSATTSVQRFIYNDITGALLFDEDGSASGFTQVKFAELSAGLSLTENNFVVV